MCVPSRRLSPVPDPRQLACCSAAVGSPGRRCVSGQPAVLEQESTHWAVPAIVHSSGLVAAVHARRQLAIASMSLPAAGRAANVAAVAGTTRICWVSDRVADWTVWMAAATVAVAESVAAAAAEVVDIVAAVVGIARGN